MFHIYRNGTKLPYEIAATKQAAKTFIQMFLKSTHMGQWIKTEYGYEYATTIGQYYEFRRVKDEFIRISKDDFLAAYLEVGNGIADEHFEEFWTVLKLISERNASNE